MKMLKKVWFRVAVVLAVPLVLLTLALSLMSPVEVCAVTVENDRVVFDLNVYPGGGLAITSTEQAYIVAVLWPKQVITEPITIAYELIPQEVITYYVGGGNTSLGGWASTASQLLYAGVFSETGPMETVVVVPPSSPGKTRLYLVRVSSAAFTETLTQIVSVYNPAPPPTPTSVPEPQHELELRAEPYTTRAGELITFTNVLTPLAGWSVFGSGWDFGDGCNRVEVPPDGYTCNHQPIEGPGLVDQKVYWYENPGSYAVRLGVSLYIPGATSDGISDTVQVEILPSTVAVNFNANTEGQYGQVISPTGAYHLIAGAYRRDSSFTGTVSITFHWVRGYEYGEGAGNVGVGVWITDGMDLVWRGSWPAEAALDEPVELWVRVPDPPSQSEFHRLTTTWQGATREIGLYNTVEVRNPLFGRVYLPLVVR